MTFWINAPASRYADADGPAVVERLLTRIRQVPGVTEAAVNRCTPYGSSCARTLLFMPGRSTRPSDAPVVGRHYVSGSLLPRAGHRAEARAAADRRRPRGTPGGHGDQRDRGAAVLARRGSDRQTRLVLSNPGFTDPGAARRSRRRRGRREVLADQRSGRARLLHVVPAVHLSLVAVRRSRPPDAATVAARDPARDRRGRPDACRSTTCSCVDERVAEAVARPRFTATATALFAISAAALAAMGVFGVMAYSVSMRREELALRLALGETPRGLQLRRADRRPREARDRPAALPACSPASGCCGRSAAPSTASRRPIRRCSRSRSRRWARRARRRGRPGLARERDRSDDRPQAS